MSEQTTNFPAAADALLRDRNMIFLKLVAECEQLMIWDEHLRNARDLAVKTQGHRDASFDALQAFRGSMDKIEAEYQTLTGEAMPKPPQPE